MKDVHGSFKYGQYMRFILLGGDAFNGEHDNNNSIRSYVYRLANLSSVGDVDQFFGTIIRMYSGYEIAMPSIFKYLYQSEEDFKAISHGYILGLKCPLDIKYLKEKLLDDKDMPKGLKTILKKENDENE